MNKYLLTFLICTAIVIMDQVSKYLVTVYIPLYGGFDVLPILSLTHIRNSGVAFGMLQNIPPAFKLPFFISVFIAAVVGITILIKGTSSGNKTFLVGLSLILSGAVGNSIDRFRQGYVTDFIDIHWFNNPSLQWPPFNVSDSAITIGAIIVIVIGIFFNDQHTDVYRNN